MKRTAVALTLLGLAAAATPSFSQAPALQAPAPQAPAATARNGGADPKAIDAFAGATRDAFYAVEERLAELLGRATGNRRATAELRSIRAFTDQRKARHGGELRDWDREVIATRLGRVEQMLG